MNPDYLRECEDGVMLTLKVQPRASRNEICTAAAGELRVRVTAPPVDAAANEALIRFLAERLELPRNRLDLVRGHTSRHKTVLVRGMSGSQAAEKLSSTPGAR